MRDGQRLRTLALLFAAALMAACSDSSLTAPVAPTIEPDHALSRVAPAAQAQLASVRWNAVARDLVAAGRTSPPMAARYYALLSIAQQRATDEAHASVHVRPAPQLHDAVRAAVAANPAASLRRA